MTPEVQKLAEEIRQAADDYAHAAAEDGRHAFHQDTVALQAKLHAAIDRLAALTQPAPPVQEAVAWVRFCSDGSYEGPLMNFDRRMDGARREPGGWTPLYSAPASPPGWEELVQKFGEERAKIAVAYLLGDEAMVSAAPHHPGETKP